MRFGSGKGPFKCALVAGLFAHIWLALTMFTGLPGSNIALHASHPGGLLCNQHICCGEQSFQECSLSFGVG